MQNTATINSTVGEGAYGHLGRVLAGKRYLQLMGVNFAPPNNLGPVPVLSCHFMGPTELENLCITHRQQLNTYQKYHNMDKALQNQLLASVNDEYTKALKQNPVGYMNRNTFEVLQHLYSDYGHIMPAMLQALYAAMDQPYNPTLPIEDLFDQINVVQDLAMANGTGYSEPQVISITCALIFQLENAKVQDRYCLVN
eukprot:2207804-Ditylum_brightwellii.AAC.1